MSKLVIIFLSIFGVLMVPYALAIRPAHDFSDMPVAQLLDLLENGAPEVRADAAVFLGYRYRKPGVVVNPPTWKEQHPELPLPPKVVPRLAQHLASDGNMRVRIAVMRALQDLRFHTNTTAIVATGLEDTNAYVRIHTCGALINMAHDYSEPLHEKVILTLRKSLSVNGAVEPTWIAAWYSGQLGAAGKPLLPELLELSNHNSSKVRHYASEATKIIQQDTKGRKE